ncbi:MAG: RNA-binding protein [Eubacteriales bacterium]|nr:RNA-binding protein [Eubacteriales bacterium]MDN5364029.1 RNA-binding protein [Eubacteriales bacterium]
MLELTGKQKRYLRSLAVKEEPILQIGKGGINEAVIKQLDDALEARELVKVRLLRNCPLTQEEAGEKMAEATGACLVQVVGSVLVFYRPSREKPPRIVLP